MVRAADDRITIYPPDGLIDELRKDRSLWDDTDIFKQSKDGDYEPPVSALVCRAVMRYLTAQSKRKASVKMDELYNK